MVKMNKERKFDGIWDARRVLYNALSYADKKGCIPYDEKKEDSYGGIMRQRFYAALKAYGKIEKVDSMFMFVPYRIGDESDNWLSKTRSLEKMNELRELLKQNLGHDFFKRAVDAPDFLSDRYNLFSFFGNLLQYRRELNRLYYMWSDVLEGCRVIGLAMNVTDFLYRKHIIPACDVIDRMLILLMGDDFDKTFTEKELLSYGYPDVTDEELYQMSLKEER